MFFRSATFTAAVTLTLALVSGPSASQAQSSPEHNTEPSNERVTSFDLADDGLDLVLDFEAGDVEEGDSRWQLVVREPDADDALSEIPVPDWVGRDHYEFDVDSAEIDDTHHVVLFTATPGARSEPPPSAPEFKAAWVVHEERDQKQWRHVGSTQYSELDGGSRMYLREREGQIELVRFRPDGAERFCGVGETDTFAYERFEVDANRFVTEFDIDALEKTADPIDSRIGDPDFTPPLLQGWFQWFIASSDARTPDERESLIRPLELGDFRLEIGWSEGVAGLGRGEFVTAQINNAVPMTALRLFPGDGVSAERHKRSAKPRKLLIALQNGERYVFDVPQIDYKTLVDHHGVTIELPEPVRTNCLTLVLLESAPGKVAADAPEGLATAVTMAEATPYSVLHGDSPEQTAQNLVDFVASTEDPRRRERVSELGLTIGEPLVAAVLEKMREGTPKERRRVIPLLASIPSDEAVPLLADYLEHFGPGDEEYRAIKRALAAHHRNSSKVLVRYVRSMEDPTSRKYVDMVRLLGRVGEPADIAILLDDLGKGESRVRNERCRAIAKAGEELVDELVVAAAREPNSEESHDAIKTLNLIGRRMHYTDQGTLPKAELYLETVQKTEKRRTLMRALRTAKYFQTDGYADLVSETYTDYPDPLVRREAIGALGRYPGAQARKLVLEALSDRSPDVRIAAAETLGERSDGAQSVDELRAYIGEERWKAGLQEAFETLARIEDASTDEIFVQVLDERPNSDATLIAFQALNRQERAIDGARIVAGLRGPVSRNHTQLELIDNLGFDDSREGRDWLTEAVAKTPTDGQQQDARTLRDVRRVRRHAILALGRRREAPGRRTLLELARSTADEDVRQVAIRALGFYASPKLLEALRQWHREAEPVLREQLQDTIDMVDRRISIDDAEDDVVEAIEDIEEAEASEDNSRQDKSDQEP